MRVKINWDSTELILDQSVKSYVDSFGVDTLEEAITADMEQGPEFIEFIGGLSVSSVEVLEP